MKILVLNGSPRKGNTNTAVNTFMDAAKEFDCEEIILNNLNIRPCQACDSCGCNSKCAHNDDTNMLVEKIDEADFVLFATPVYWWSMSAQLKLAVDKLYARCDAFGEKKMGVIAIGQAELDGPQYELIDRTFRCIAGYLKWDVRFYLPISAGDRDDLSKDEKNLKAIEELVKRI